MFPVICIFGTLIPNQINLGKIWGKKYRIEKCQPPNYSTSYPNTNQYYLVDCIDISFKIGEKAPTSFPCPYSSRSPACVLNGVFFLNATSLCLPTTSSKAGWVLTKTRPRAKWSGGSTTRSPSRRLTSISKSATVGSVVQTSTLCEVDGEQPCTQLWSAMVSGFMPFERPCLCHAPLFSLLTAHRDRWHRRACWFQSRRWIQGRRSCWSWCSESVMPEIRLRAMLQRR